MDPLLLVCFFTFGTTIDAYNILILFPTPSFSHQQSVMILTEALVNKGHRLFVVSPNVVPGLEDNNNYTHVDMSFSNRLYAGGVDNTNDKEAANLQKRVSSWHLPDFARQLVNIPSNQFKSEKFKQFQRKVKEEKIKFDVIIGQSHFTPFTCGMARFLTGGSKPFITYSTFSMEHISGDLLSLPHPSFQPYWTPYTDQMSLGQKIHNWIIALVWMPKIRGILEDGARAFFQQNLGPEYGTLVDGCWRNASLAMVGANFLHYYPKHTAPNVIELGPMHIRPPAELPKDLQAWLDGAQKGVIYISFGSNLRSKSLPVGVRSNLVRVFNELPDGYRVLWKWELDGKTLGQSDKILTRNWLPQQSVLAHPKVKLFIMQGGFQSFQEALHYGVPILGIPWSFDQEMNVAKMEASGIGVGLWPEQLYSHEKVKLAVDKLLHDESYMLNMKKLSAISRDFTPHAVDKAVFWVEHVARHGDTSHLRPSTADSTYFQYFCLDIISVILAFVFVILYIFYLGIKFLTSIILPKSSLKLKKS